jgi:hypothetical protein
MESLADWIHNNRRLFIDDRDATTKNRDGSLLSLLCTDRVLFVSLLRRLQFVMGHVDGKDQEWLLNEVGVFETNINGISFSIYGILNERWVCRLFSSALICNRRRRLPSHTR